MLTVEAIGYQFGFQFRYPKLAQPVVNELHLPVNTPITIHVTSRDVLHGFWIPELRMKADMVPGLINTMRVTPTLPGTYRIMCTEFCGVAHGAMKSQAVIVQNQQDFAKWFAQQGGGGAGGGGNASGGGARRRGDRARPGQGRRRPDAVRPEVQRLPLDRPVHAEAGRPGSGQGLQRSRPSQAGQQHRRDARQRRRDHPERLPGRPRRDAERAGQPDHRTPTSRT